MADIWTFNNFSGKFLRKSGFGTKRLPLWKKWTSFTIQHVRRVLLHNFVHWFQRRSHIFLGYETLSCFWDNAFNWVYRMKLSANFFDISAIDDFSRISSTPTSQKICRLFNGPTAPLPTWLGTGPWSLTMAFAD